MAPGVQDLHSRKPFINSNAAYRKKGWAGTLPLPFREKHPPPVGFTGHRHPYPQPSTIAEWENDPAYARSNIGIRLAGVTEEHEIIGIDVDHYVSGTGDKAKNKLGGDQLAQLETRLGALPATWTSSARVDGISGIRYYRVPRGFAFVGKADKDIDVISKGFRFAVVWPSIHPTGSQYWWFPPGTDLTEAGKRCWDVYLNDGAGPGEGLPDARELPLLPQAWLDHLSSGGMKANDDEVIDMVSTVSEMFDWAQDIFNDGGQIQEDGRITGLCMRTTKSIIQQQKKIMEDATSHDKIIEIHWHMYRLAAEGHLGWHAGIKALEALWIKDVVERDKRGLQELRAEIFRSSINALRKVKAQVDQNISVGAAGVVKSCPCRADLHAIGTDDNGDVVVLADGGRVGAAGDALPVVSVDPEGSGEGGDDDKIDFDFSKIKFQYVQKDKDGNIITDDDGNPITSDKSSGRYLIGNGSDVSDLSDADKLSIAGDDDYLDPILRYVLRGPAKDPDEYEMNDDGNADHFLDLFSPIDVGPVVRWVEGVGWLLWCSGGQDKLTDEVVQPHWIVDNDGLIRRAWNVVKRRQMAYADILYDNFQLAFAAAQVSGSGNGINQAGNPAGALLAQKKQADNWYEFARKSGNNQTANAALEALKLKQGVTMDVNDFDAKPNLLGVANGVIDLEASQEDRFRPMRPEDHILLNTNVEYHQYDKVSKTSRRIWEGFLDKFVNVGSDGEEFLRAVKTCMGYGLLGDNPQRSLIFIKGPSSTGKSTMLNAIGAAMGDYSTVANITIFQNHKLNPMLARALPKRYVMMSELSDNEELSVSMVKSITGNEVVSAELKGSNAIIERKPSFLPIIATNSTPSIEGADEAFRRRLIVLPFENVVEEELVDVGASNRLEAYCREAILSWLVEGYDMYVEDGRTLPRQNAKLDRASAETMSEFDHVATFINERIEKHPSFKDANKMEWGPQSGYSQWTIKIEELFTEYIKWCDSENMNWRNMVTRTKLTKRLTSLGFHFKQTRSKDDGQNMKRWVGVKFANVSRVGPQNGRINVQSVKTKSEDKQETDKGKK